MCKCKHVQVIVQPDQLSEREMQRLSKIELVKLSYSLDRKERLESN